jgi:hypothetical protein
MDSVKLRVLRPSLEVEFLLSEDARLRAEVLRMVQAMRNGLELAEYQVEVLLYEPKVVPL